MLRGGDDLAKVFCASTGYGTYNILYSIYDHYLPIYLSTYLHTRTWNLIFFLFVLQKHLANDRRSATTDPACIIQYSIMCLVTVHQWSRRVRGGGIVVMANTGLLRLRQAYLVSNLYEDDDSTARTAIFPI